MNPATTNGQIGNRRRVTTGSTVSSVFISSDSFTVTMVPSAAHYRTVNHQQ